MYTVLQNKGGGGKSQEKQSQKYTQVLIKRPKETQPGKV